MENTETELKEFIHASVTKTAANASDEDHVLLELQREIFGKFLGYIDAACKRVKSRNFSDIEKEYEEVKKKVYFHDEFMKEWNGKYAALDAKRKNLDALLKRFPYFEVIGIEQTLDELKDKAKEYQDFVVSVGDKERICSDLNNQFLENKKNPVRGFTPKIPANFDSFFDLTKFSGASTSDKLWSLLYKYFYSSNGPVERPANGKFYREVDNAKRNLSATNSKISQLQRTLDRYNKSNEKHDEIESKLEDLEKEFVALNNEKSKLGRKWRIDFAEKYLENLRIERDNFKTSDYAILNRIREGIEKAYVIYQTRNGGPLMQYMYVSLKRISQGAWADFRTGDLSYYDRNQVLDLLYKDLSSIEWRGTDFNKWISSADINDADLVKVVINKICERTGKDIASAVNRSFKTMIENRRNELHVNYKEDDDKDPLENMAAPQEIMTEENYFDDIFVGSWAVIKDMFMNDLDNLAIRCIKYFKGSDINYNKPGYPPGSHYPKSPLSGWVPAKFDTFDIEVTDEGTNTNGWKKEKFETGMNGYYLPVSKLKEKWKIILKQVFNIYDSDFMMSGKSRDNIILPKVKSILKTSNNMADQAKTIIDFVDLFICEKIIMSFKSNKVNFNDRDINDFVKEHGISNLFIQKFSKIRNGLVSKLSD